jgi:hypothetical protein
LPKRKKNDALPREAKPAAIAPAVHVAHPPAKNPTLLGVSMALFALWFVFLLVAAIWG